MTRSTPVEGREYRLSRCDAPTRIRHGTHQSISCSRAANRYIVDDEDQPEDLLNDLERFGTAAFKEDVRGQRRRGTLRRRTWNTRRSRDVERSLRQGAPEVRARPTANGAGPLDIRELYVNNLASLLREFGDGSLQQDIAEVLYAKDPGEDGPHPGRVCTGIKEMPESSVTDCISKSRWPQHRGSASFTPILRPEKPGNCSLASEQLPLCARR